MLTDCLLPRRAVRDDLLLPVRQRPEPAVLALRMEHREYPLDVLLVVFDANVPSIARGLHVDL